MRHFVTLAAVALGLAVALPAVPATASAAEASTLTVTDLRCRDVDGGGPYYNNTECFASTSGGAGGNTYDWHVIVNYQEDGPNSSYIQGVCTDSYDVTITVRDASGDTASMSGSFFCEAKSPGGGLEP
jgi:hypothetical protein